LQALVHYIAYLYQHYVIRQQCQFLHFSMDRTF